MHALGIRVNTFANVRMHAQGSRYKPNCRTEEPLYKLQGTKRDGNPTNAQYRGMSVYCSRIVLANRGIPQVHSTGACVHPTHIE